MTNIVKVAFGATREARTRPLYQYDYGQILRFEGVELPQAYEVHFANHDSLGEAKPQIGDALVEAAKWYHIPVFDLYWNCMMFKQNRFEYFNTNDGTHPKAAGLQLMAGMISEQLETRYQLSRKEQNQ